MGEPIQDMPTSNQPLNLNAAKVKALRRTPVTSGTQFASQVMYVEGITGC